MTTEVLRLGIDAKPAVAGAAVFNTAGKKVQQTSTAMTASMGGVSKAAGAMGAAINAAFAVVFAGGAVVGAAKVIADFEHSMATLRAVTRGTEEDLGALSAQARELGSATRFSAAEAATAQIVLARAGFETQEILSTTAATLNLATGQAIGLEEAATITAASLRQFGLGAESANAVTDVLTNTANSADTNVTQLAEALKFAGPVAAKVGENIASTAAAIGVLGNNAIKGSQAGTNMRGIILGLASPTDQARDAIKRMGLEMEDLDPKTNSLVDIFGKLANANFTVTEATELFGRRNATAALILADSVDQMKALTEANENAGGVAAESAKIMESTLGGTFKELISTVQELMLRLGDSGLLAGLKELVKGITFTIRLLSGMADETEIAGSEFQRAAKVALFLNKHAKALAATLGILVGLNFAKVIGGWTLSMLKFNAAMLATPIGFIAAGVGLAITAYQEFGDEQVKLADESVQVKDIIFGTWDAIRDRLPVLAENMGNLWTGLQVAAREAMKWISDKWGEFTNWLGVDWTDVFRLIGDAIVGFAKFSVQTIITVVRTIGILIGRMKDAFAAFGQFDITSPIDSARKVGKALKSALSFSGLANDVRGAWRKSGMEVDIAAREISNTLGKWSKDTGEWLAGNIAEPIEQRFREFVDEVESNAVNRSRERTSNERAKELAEAAAKLEELKKRAASADFKVDPSDIADLIEVKNTLVGGAEDADTAMKGLNETIGDSMTSAFESMGNSAFDFFDKLADGTANTRDFIRGIIGDIKGIVNQAFIKPAFAQIASSVAGAFGFTTSAMGNVFNGGRVVPFANGGIPDVGNQPAAFGMAGGIGTLREGSQFEAIMPLKRGAGGKLGVEVNGGGGGGGLSLSLGGISIDAGANGGPNLLELEPTQQAQYIGQMVGRAIEQDSGLVALLAARTRGAM